MKGYCTKTTRTTYTLASFELIKLAKQHLIEAHGVPADATWECEWDAQGLNDLTLIFIVEETGEEMRFSL